MKLALTLLCRAVYFDFSFTLFILRAGVGWRGNSSSRFRDDVHRLIVRAELTISNHIVYSQAGIEFIACLNVKAIHR